MKIVAAIKNFRKDIGRLFYGWNLVWQASAIGITYILVISGADFWARSLPQAGDLSALVFIAGMGGFVVPLVLPIAAWAIGGLRRSAKLIKTGWAIAQVEVMALLLSIFYKALTGRPAPNGFGPASSTLVDISGVWQFGWLQGGVYWGWPSSHITVAVAAMTLLVMLYWRQPIVRYLSLAWAAYVFLIVSTTFHWLSDGAAGAIFGVVIGLTVAKSVSCCEK